MGQSKRIRLSDVRAIFHLIGECRELGIDSTLWRTHMLTGLLRMTGGQIAMGGPAAIKHGYLQPDPAPAVDLGWAGHRERSIFGQFLQDEMHLQDPALVALGRYLSKRKRNLVSLTRCRQQLIDDTTWYNSAAFCDYHRPSGTDDAMMSVVALANGAVHGIAMFRPPRERRFTLRHVRLLHLFHTELAPHLLTELAPPGEDPISRLSPRQREVLARLLEGDSEQQIAQRLGLTRDTAHQYIKAVYRRLNVNTRAELMACFVRFPEGILRRAPTT
jgi:DNA-binding CsgD family transcriptional regulator